MPQTRRLNCWEYRDCGREQGGVMAPILGVCPVTTAMKFDGYNGGIAAGRACWLVPNSGCRSNGINASSVRGCHQCEFYRRVMNEEKDKVVGALHSESV